MNEGWIDKFNSLTGREKIIICSTLLVLVWATWDTYFYQPLSVQHKLVLTELATANVQLLAKQQLATQIENAGKTDPDKANRLNLLQLKEQQAKLQKQMGLGEKKFVPAHLMAKVLQDLLQYNKGLKLLKLETIPVTTLSVTGQQQSWVYLHGLSITLSGNFFNTLDYLKSMESLPWRINWEAIEYKVKKYPLAETRLRVYTLSFEENWLGL